MIPHPQPSIQPRPTKGRPKIPPTTTPTPPRRFSPSTFSRASCPPASSELSSERSWRSETSASERRSGSSPPSLAGSTRSFPSPSGSLAANAGTTATASVPRRRCRWRSTSCCGPPDRCRPSTSGSSRRASRGDGSSSAAGKQRRPRRHRRLSSRWHQPRWDSSRRRTSRGGSRSPERWRPTTGILPRLRCLLPPAPTTMKKKKTTTTPSSRWRMPRFEVRKIASAGSAVNRRAVLRDSTTVARAAAATAPRGNEEEEEERRPHGPGLRVGIRCAFHAFRLAGVRENPGSFLAFGSREEQSAHTHRPTDRPSVESENRRVR
mmetsp:Transcript_19724/g.46066  ORF Transcript_19724/g.46066 Transcript_19724/m.46066 type:complete len:321 (-) Transcript_19724:338-1300(-)